MPNIKCPFWPVDVGVDQNLTMTVLPVYKGILCIMYL